MNLKLRYLSVLVLMMLTSVFTLPALAQDELTRHVNLDGYTISVPGDWKVGKEELGGFNLTSDAISAVIATPDNLIDLGHDPSDEATKLLGEMLWAADVFVSPRAFTSTTYGERPAVSYTYLSEDERSELHVVVEMSDGKNGYIHFTTPEGGLDENADLINAIITSFDNADESPAVSDTGTTGTASTVSCTVSTNSTDGAQLRVGPGTNRGAISFLPVNSDVTVTGRIELDDGSVWFQLDKDQAAPNGTAAAELWVAAESVDASGACDSVGDTSAPPVIPISVAPPSNSSPENNGAPSGDQSASSEPGMLPAAGTWTLTLNVTMNASCQGYENVPVTTSELYDPTVLVSSLSIIDRDSFNFLEHRYTRIPGTNSFNGLITFVDGRSAQVRLNMQSANVMGGQIVDNYEIEGTPCSDTVPFRVER